MSYQELKSGITTRRALINTTNSLLRITKPGATNLVRQNDGSITTNYERREFAIVRSVRERQKSMKAKALNVKQPENNIGSLKQAKLSPDKRPISDFSAKSLSRFIETQSREINRSSQERAKRYFSNYTSALYSVFGGYAEYDSAIESIEEKILQLAKEDFSTLQQAIDDAPSIKYIYDPIARDTKMNEILRYWNAQ